MNQTESKQFWNRIKGGLIVSCQALKEEPLYSSYIMSRMAYAAMLGGAVGIRANTIGEILTEIKKTRRAFQLSELSRKFTGTVMYTLHLP